MYVRRLTESPAHGLRESARWAGSCCQSPHVYKKVCQNLLFSTRKFRDNIIGQLSALVFEMPLLRLWAEPTLSERLFGPGQKFQVGQTRPDKISGKSYIIVLFSRGCLKIFETYFGVYAANVEFISVLSNIICMVFSRPKKRPYKWW